MALRARLAAPAPEPKNTWIWHTAKCGVVSSSVLSGGDRRMEAETYLSSGFGIRVAIEGKPAGWIRFGELAEVWMPDRLKGIQVATGFGTPFLSATQVFDVRPLPRKFLALDQIRASKDYFVDNGVILVTRSGSVGRPTVAYAAHANTLISDDLLRISPRNMQDHGWLYAFLHAPQVRAMTTSVHYGHIIKHLETSHLEALPVPIVDDKTTADFAHRLTRILDLRNESHRFTLEAEARLEQALGLPNIPDWGEQGFVIRAAKAFFYGRRRLDASVHSPGVAALHAHLAKRGEGFTTIVDAGYDVWVPGRYKRIPAEDGVVYRDSADLLEASPDLTKRFADCRFGDEFRGRVKSGWVLVPSSGQVYGIIGTAVLATEALNDQVVSNHVIRLAPRKDASIRAGYLVTALSHPTLGQPLVKFLAFGSSVPEIDSADLANLGVVRVKATDESAIGDVAEAAAKARAAADMLESEIAQDAGAIVDRFISCRPG
jgi:type I restriction enzyme S subunit